VLAALKEQPSIPLRLTIAAHPNADENTLAALGCDIDDRVRARASENPKFPDVIFNLLIAAGSTPDMQGVTSQFGDLSEEQISQLADLGAWGRFLAARHPGCPAELLTAITSDPEWRVRSGLLDNPHTPESLIQDMLDVSVSEKVENIRYLTQSHIPETFLSALANHPSPEVRMALARHPAATPDILGLLATDGVKEIRSYAAKHPRIKMGDIELMVRAGSTPDLMGLSEPDPGMTADEIQALLDGGVWARQLAVRHPNTGADTLARLLCDREPKIREWAAVHPNLSNEIKRELIRAGSGTDFQGIMPADPGLPPEALYRISQLGSWGEWVVANNPHAPAELLDTLGESDDWQVRLFVAKNPGTSAAVVARLRNDAVEEVCQAAQSQNRSERR
jgi:hypothetical protein